MPPKAQPDKPPRKRIDWPAARAEYVNNPALTYAEIAKKYSANESTVRMRAAKEDWVQERAHRATILQQELTKKSIADTVDELAKYNEQDLIAAKGIRQTAWKQLQEGDLEPKDVRALAGAIESAQRIARLALGASTEHIDERTTIVSEFEAMTSEERVAKARQLYIELFPQESLQ